MDEGISEYLFDISPEWFGHELEGCEGINAGQEPGAVDLFATKHGREVLIQGRVRASVEITCVRCLRPFQKNIGAEVDVLMLPGNPATNDQHEDEDDLGVERYRGDHIHLDELIRDSLVLEIPMNPNCGDDCPGWDYLEAELKQ